MTWLAYIATYVLSYSFGAFTFPQIIGSIRMIAHGFKKPYIFTLILWTAIFVGATLLMYYYLPTYLVMYLVALIIPLISTIFTKNIE